MNSGQLDINVVGLAGGFHGPLPLKKPLVPGSLRKPYVVWMERLKELLKLRDNAPKVRWSKGAMERIDDANNILQTKYTT